MARLELSILDNYQTIKKETLDKDKTLVIVVDMVVGFCKEGVMSDPAILDIVGNIQDILHYFPHHLYFQDAHEKDCCEFDVFPKHCVINGHESEIVDALKDDANNSTIIPKNSTNGFMAPNFMKQAGKLADRYDHFIVIGCCTDICVLQFVLSWMGYLQQNNIRNKDICVPVNAVDSYHLDGIHDVKEYNQMALSLMKNAGVKIVKELK